MRHTYLQRCLLVTSVEKQRLNCNNNRKTMKNYLLHTYASTCILPKLMLISQKESLNLPDNPPKLKRLELMIGSSILLWGWELNYRAHCQEWKTFTYEFLSNEWLVGAASVIHNKTVLHSHYPPSGTTQRLIGLQVEKWNWIKRRMNIIQCSILCHSILTILQSVIVCDNNLLLTAQPVLLMRDVC